jgi:uncharacterized protein YqjF (DUF2071 family)
MLNYEVDARILLPLVPAGTELDLWNGKAYASVVGFLFLNTRLAGIPIPFHRNFEEVNLRFYVQRKTGNEVRRGVVFIRELVPRFAIAATARRIYNEKYLSLPMKHRIEHQTSSFFRYEWKYENQWNFLQTKTVGAPKPLIAGSEEAFITEHFWGYAAQRDGGCMEYQVEHPQWKIWRAEQSELNCNIAALYGPQFVDALQSQPASAFVAEGSAIIVRKGLRIH